MNPLLRDRSFEPTAWLLIFATSTGKPWLDRLIPGHFKHVSASGWVSEAKVWIFYDVAWARTSIKLLPEEAGDIRYALLQRGNGVLKVDVDRETRGAAMFRLGFWCVPAVKHLIGSRSGALRPDRLWRDLIANGAKAISHDAETAGSAGSDRRRESGSAGGEGRQAGHDAGCAAA